MNMEFGNIVTVLRHVSCSRVGGGTLEVKIQNKYKESNMK